MLEACENYQKQSYRNRCYILGPQGPQMLQVPIVHGPDKAISKVRVDYSTPWVLQTERALDTAYETAAYYGHYREGLFSILESQPDTLWELNLALANFLLKGCGIACELRPTCSFQADAPDDYRNAIHPKREDGIEKELGLGRPYYQVFRDAMGGFTPRLSGLDLLLNEGPGSLLFLKTIRK